MAGNGDTDKGPDGRPRSALVVDDDPICLTFASLYLERLGYAVTALADGGEALQHVRTEPWRYDLVILDHEMPKLTGLELARELRALRPEVPLVLCSGYAQGFDLHSLRETGIDEYLPKPFTVVELQAALDRAIGRSEG